MFRYVCFPFPTFFLSASFALPLPAQEPVDPERAALRADAARTTDAVVPDSKPASFLAALNPALTVFADAIYLGVDGKLTAPDEAGNPVDVGDRFALREVELDLRADIDPRAKGVLVVALEEELPEEYAITIEEGYAAFTALPYNLHARAGRMRTAFGVMNRLHKHDLPSFESNPNPA
jgi:hypothetical protein